MRKVDKNNTGRGPLCNYNCSNTNNPADLHLVYTLSYVQRNYLCEGSTYSDLYANWVISVPFTPLTTFGGNSSSGTIKVTSPSSSVSTLSTNSINIRSLGTDPYCPANTLYEITYNISSWANTYFGSGMNIEASLSLYNNCSLVGNLVSTGYVAAPDINLVADQPCYRIDKIYVTPNNGPSNCATITGNYNICFYPSGFTPIDYHQVEYRLVNNGSGSLQWADQTSSVHWGEPTGTNTEVTTLSPYTGTSDLVLMVPSSGTWLVRYRNVKTSYCDLIYDGTNSNPSPGPVNAGGDWGFASLWVTEVWPL